MQAIFLNSEWKFKKLPEWKLERLPDPLPEGPWEEVTLPHTWYKTDDAYQGLAVYEKTVKRDKAWPRAFLSFEAADQQCRVFVNGHEAGSHRGGYARFRLPIPGSMRKTASTRTSPPPLAILRSTAACTAMRRC